MDCKPSFGACTPYLVTIVTGIVKMAYQQSLVVLVSVLSGNSVKVVGSGGKSANTLKMLHGAVTFNRYLKVTIAITCCNPL